jgi:glycosyltransferase involved in cell wall biosynthesis
LLGGIKKIYIPSAIKQQAAIIGRKNSGRNMKKLGVFVPVYNEERIVEKNLMRIISEARKQGLDINIYAVDDSSTDSTPKILKNLEKRFRNFRLIRYENGSSRRENLADAMAKAKEPYIMFLDLDLATSPKYLSKLYALLEGGADLVTGSRYSGNSRVKRGLGRLTISIIYNTLMKIYLGSRIKDHQCGFKGFRAERFREINRISGYDPKKIRGWFWDAEILVIAQKKGFNIVEFASDWDEGKQSSFNLKREIKMLPYVFSLPLKLRKFRL